jgi:hypothetical protein
VERIKFWENEQDRQIRAALIKGATAMLKNHTDIAVAMLVKALKALQNISLHSMQYQH